MLSPLQIPADMIRVLVSRKDVPQLSAEFLFEVFDDWPGRLEASGVDGDQLICLGLLDHIANVVGEKRVQVQIRYERVIV